MTPVTVEGKTLLSVKAIKGFECVNCILNNKEAECVRINPDTKELYFDRTPVKNSAHLLYCINQEHDMVFIKNTPKQIAKYVATRLENS